MIKAYLHCMVCSLNGEHPGEHSRIATVLDLTALKRPVNPDMFLSLYPDRILQPPWQPGATWEEMICPRCHRLIWCMTEVDIQKARQAGGPDKVLLTLYEPDPDSPVTKIFYLDEFGLKERASKRPPVDKAAQMLEMYKGGMTLHDIRKFFGLAHHTQVRHLLVAHFPEEYKAVAQTRPHKPPGRRGWPKLEPSGEADKKIIRGEITVEIPPEGGDINGAGIDD